MPTIEKWVRAGITIKSGTKISGFVGGFPPVDSEESYTFVSDHVVTGVNGAYTEFSASSFDNIIYTVNEVIGEEISIPRGAPSQHLFNGGYATRTFFGGATNSSNADFQGNGQVYNDISSSINDGVVGN